MSNPPYMSFVFSTLPTPTTTLCGKTSAHAARQSCVLNGLYDTCGVGFEFAQEPDGDAGVPPSNAGAGDAGDAGPSIPRSTIPFDISRYKAFTFWGMTTTPDPTTGYMQVKVQFPDTDTDPRGEICNGGGGEYFEVLQQLRSRILQLHDQLATVHGVAGRGGDGGVAPADGIAIDPTWGYQRAQWIPTQVYGINWQAQRNDDPGRWPSPHDRHLGRRRVLRRVNQVAEASLAAFEGGEPGNFPCGYPITAHHEDKPTPLGPVVPSDSHRLGLPYADDRSRGWGRNGWFRRSDTGRWCIRNKRGRPCWCRSLTRPAEVPGLQARREMAKQAVRERRVPAEHPVAAEVERLEPEELPLEAPEVRLGARSAAAVRVRAVRPVHVEPPAAVGEAAAAPARAPTLTN